MRLPRMFMGMLRRAQEEPGLPQQPAAEQPSDAARRRPSAPWTSILMRFTDGTSRTFIYDRRSLTGKALQDALDPLIDEMAGADFAGPIEVYRSTVDGNLDHETVGLLTADE